MHLRAQRADVLDLVLQHIPWQPVSRDAGHQHTARGRQGIVDRHLVATPGQLISRRQTRRTRAHDADFLGVLHRYRLRAILLQTDIGDTGVISKAFQGADR